MPIRSVKLKLSHATAKKLDSLELVRAEYARAVNEFIGAYWQSRKLPSYGDRSLASSPMLKTGMMQCAANQALAIVKSSRAAELKARMKKRYKKAYRYFASNGRQKAFVAKKFHELNLTPKIKPVFDGSAMVLNSSVIRPLAPKRKTIFSSWVSVGGIGGRKLALRLPVNHHRQFKKYYNDPAWEMKQSMSIEKHGGDFYLCVFFESHPAKHAKTGRKIGIDSGINTLCATSDGRLLGQDLKKMICKLAKKKQGSARWKRQNACIKQYIDKVVKDIGIGGCDLIVLEDLRSLAGKSKKKKKAKKTRILFQWWNRGRFVQRIKDECALNGVELAFVDPRFTSQACGACGCVNNKNRTGEVFKCQRCGHEANADLNAAGNILNKFLLGEAKADANPSGRKSGVVNTVLSGGLANGL